MLFRSLLKRGTGNLTLSGTNTFTGNTTINHGNLIVQGGAALADTGTVTIAGTNATFTVAFSESLWLAVGASFVIGACVCLTQNLIPIAVGMVILVALAVIINNAFSTASHHYPVHWW